MLTFSPTTVIPAFASRLYDPFLFPSCSCSSKQQQPTTKPKYSKPLVLTRTIETQTTTMTPESINLLEAALQLIKISDEFGPYLDSIKITKSSSSQNSWLSTFIFTFKTLFVFIF